MDEKLTLCNTLQHVDLIVPRPAVRDPFDSASLGERTDDYLVKHAESIRGPVVTVDPDDTSYLPPDFRPARKSARSGESMSCWMGSVTHDDAREAVKELFHLFVRPVNILVSYI